MHILHLSRTIDPIGGCEIYIRNLLKHSHAQGIKLSLITDLVLTDPLPVDIESRHSIHFLSGLSHQSTRESLTRLTPLISRTQPDLIHIHDLNNPYVIEWCGKNYPTVKTTLNADTYCGGSDKYLFQSQRACTRKLGYGCIAVAYKEKCMKRHPRRAFEIISIKKKALQVINSLFCVMVPSHSSRRIMIQNGVPENKIKILPLFADFSDMKVVAPSPKKVPIITFLGRLKTYKGLHYLIRALARVDHSYQFNIIGTGEFSDEYTQLIQECGIKSRTTILTNVPHDKVLTHLDRSNMVVVPSIYPDSFPTVGLEAMMRGKPVVGFKMGGIPEWLQDGQTGLLVKPQDTTGLRDAIVKLILNPAIATRMGQAGKHYYEEHFTAKHHLTALQNIYCDAIAWSTSSSN